ncbi:uncharacterized protein LOC117903906 [Drosophila subobscura]|uniref:uncharacterized protein LOC117903906 n=1 Tax=Drosophila subobscura TaxID=7241 RepID=UPI00155AF6AC|nr:uncharacterized protein LOC117903906 [Drosophila subobscura]
MAGKASQAKQDETSEDNVRLPKEEEQQSAAAAFFESKTFRLISIFLYLGGISGLGMVLALYYLMFFDSSMPDIHLKFPVSIGGHPVQKVHEYQ